MAYTVPVVSYCATMNGTYTALTGIQTVSMSRGRSYLQDNFAASSCVIELIPATSYALPLAIGQFIDVRTSNSSSAGAYFVGKITDVERNYSMPYNSGTGYAPADRIVITAAGGTGLLASTTIKTLTFATTTVTDQVNAILTAADMGGSINQNLVVSSLTTIGPAGLLDTVNTLMRTGQQYVDDYDNSRGDTIGLVTITKPSITTFNYNTLSTATFTDVAASSVRYNDLKFLSTGQSTFNYVNVNAAGLATQTTSAATGPFNTLNYSTSSATTADALNLSAYLYNIYSGQTAPAPFSIGTTTYVDANVLDYCKVDSGYQAYTAIGRLAAITFRGSTYAAQIQQVSVTFHLEYASAQFTFAPTLGTPFTLDSTYFGILDTNRLGYP